MNRRDFISLCTCSCCSLLLPGCSTTPITKRKQLTIYPEAFINTQAAAMYKKMIRRSKLSNDQKQLDEIIQNISSLICLDHPNIVRPLPWT